MKSNRVEYGTDTPTERGLATDEVSVRLLIAIAEQAMLDYKNVCRMLSKGHFKNKTKALDKINEFFCLREYFDSGLNGAVNVGKYSLAYQVDARLLKEGIDADAARYRANKMLARMSKEDVENWAHKDAIRRKKEDYYDVGFGEYAGRRRRSYT